MKVSLTRLLFLGVLAEIIILGVSYALHPEEGETFRYASRYSGRLSALVLLLSFYLFVFDDSSIDREENRWRKGIKLFAVLHIIHLGFLAANVHFNSITLVPVKLLGGAIAYLMIIIAPILLHRIKLIFQLTYFYYVSLVMILTYVARIRGDFEGAEPFWFHYLSVSVFVICGLVFGWLIRASKSQNTF